MHTFLYVCNVTVFFYCVLKLYPSSANIIATNLLLLLNNKTHCQEVLHSPFPLRHVAFCSSVQDTEKYLETKVITYYTYMYNNEITSWAVLTF